MTLSPHFTLAELTRTSRAALAAKNAAEAQAYLPALTALCSDILEPIRAQFGPVRINSGFRGPAVNAAVGGSATSQHSKGEAADIVCPGTDLDTLMRWIVHESGIAYGQVIREPSWIHVSLGAPWRPVAKCGQALVTTDGKTYAPWRG